MPNGKRYWILEPSDLFDGRYIRSDSNYIYYWYKQYNDTTWYEKRVINFYASQGTIDTITFAGFTFANAWNSYLSTLFNNTTITHRYGLGGLIFGDIWIADGFGYARYEYRGDDNGPIDVWELTGCIISDTFYGKANAVYSKRKIPGHIELFQNYPNPFNPTTTIEYQIPPSPFYKKGERGGFVSLKVYDLLGREVAALVDEKKPAGKYTVQWNAGKLSSGIYFFRLRFGELSQTNKMLLIR